MAFVGGPVGVVGIAPAYKNYVSSLATQAGSQLGNASAGQVWKGTGKSFFGSAGQALVGNLAGSAVNVAVNSALNTAVSGPNGLKLDSGANLLAANITPYVTSSLAAGINQSIEKSLQKAGPFGQVLSNVGTSIVNKVTGDLANSILGSAIGGANYKMFPGGGGEAKADYGGSSYTLTDVTFSIQPANKGVQSFGLSQNVNSPASATKVAFNQLSKMPLQGGNETANILKASSMTGGLGQRAFSSNLSNTFNVS